MINILGIGCAHPETIIDNQFLSELGAASSAAWIEDHTGIKTRHSILPLEYIKETGNAKPAEAVKVATATPTDLGVKACEIALEQAGVALEDVGLILASCPTPLETSPNEAQRIGKVLGVKIPAYDVSSSSGDFALHLSVLNGWKEERVPDYVLCVSTSTATRKVNYRDGKARIYLGDGAGAVLVSSRKSGRATVASAHFTSEPLQEDLFVFDLYQHAQMNLDVLQSWVAPQLNLMLETALDSADLQGKPYAFVGSGIGNSLLIDICAKHAIEEKRCWSNIEKYGYTLGASVISSIAEHWNSISAGQTIVACVAGAGTSSGYVVLKS
ncbi:hypothetical protein OAO01_06000 [Oligoflexia bacterium]|nr:hypothetical protein [Oligoflexia bacterium]